MKLSIELKLTAIALVLMFAVMPFDLDILQFVDAHSYCRPFYAAITDIGLGKWWVIPSGALFLLGGALYMLKKLPPKFARAWLLITQFFFSVAGAGLMTDIIKRIVARARPIEYLQNNVYGIFHWHEAFKGNSASHFSSFPSGHSTTMFAVATAIGFMLPEKYRDLRIPIYVLVLILMFSRLMVEAHYASDVIAGAIVGAWGAILARNYLARAKWAAAISKPDTLQ